MNNIPSKFKIGSIDYTVEYIDNLYDGTDYGIFNSATQKIILANRIKVDDLWYTVSDQMKINTFWHELFHIFHYMWDTETPEDEAQVYANFMSEFEQTKE